MNTDTSALRIHLLGGFTVEHDGEPLPPLASRGARLLFAFLALHAGRPQPRTLLADRFWPDVPESRARRRLSHALWQIQDALGELAPGHHYLVTPGDAVAFDDASPYWLDVEEFHQRLDRVDAQETVDAAGLRDLHRCVELYRGDLLAGHYEPWVIDAQKQVEHRYVTALTKIVEASKQRGNFEDALTFARRLTNQSPLREDAHREVMRLCVLLGRTSEALEQFERCRSVLLEELDTEPAAATITLFEQISRVRDVSGPRPLPATELVSRRLVARDAERITLVDELERTLAGRASTVFVEGEPGVGKTQLVAQVAEDARWRGFSVLWGRCTGGTVPYEPLVEALSEALEPVQVAQLRLQLAPVWFEAAARVLPPLRLRPAGTDGRDSTRDGRLRSEAADVTVESLARVLVALSELDPVLLVVEDAHLVDAETLDVLRTLARRRGEGRLLTVLTFRDLEAREEPGRWQDLRLLDRDARPVRLRLQPLTTFETAALLREVLGATDVPAPFAAAVHRESGGNPLYVLELLRSLRDAKLLTEDAAARLENLTIPVTDDLRSLIGRRLAHLDEVAKALLELVAVLGDEAELDVVRSASLQDGTEITRGLSELVRRNVLEAGGEGYRFTHAATRRVILDGLDPDRARALHGRAAAVLEQERPDRVEAIAHHLRGAGAPERALPYVRAAAARSLDLHAYATAADHLAVARELLEHVPVSVDVRYATLADLEEVLGVLGRRDAQGAILEELSGLVGDDVGRRVEVGLRRAVYLGHLDRFDEATPAARRAADLADDAGLRGRALTALGQVLGWAGDSVEAVTVLREAADLLEDPTAESDARLSLGTALRSLQRHEEAEHQLEKALSLAEANDDIRVVVEALGALANVRSELGRTDETIATYRRAIELARSIGYRQREAVNLVNLGTAHVLRGEPCAALEAFDRADRLFEELGNQRGQAMVRLNRGWLTHRWLGDDDDAQRDVQAAHRHFSEIGHAGMGAVCLETLAAASRGESPEAAARYLDDALASATEAGERRAEVQVRRGRAELALEVGDAPSALAEVAIAAELADDLGLREYAAELTSLEALALLTLDRPAAAWSAAERALETLEDSSEPHRIHHRVALVAAAYEREPDAQRHAVAAHEELVERLAGLDDRARTGALENVPEHRAIVAASQRIQPRRFAVSMAAESTPWGRAPGASEVVQVELRLLGAPASPAQRRQQLLAVLEQAEAQGAQPTVADLSQLFEVSDSTVRRDLRTLRGAGHDARTRGSRGA